MRHKSLFTLFVRKPSGIFYYQTYTVGGQRTVPRSTRERTEAGAMGFCNRLAHKGRLIQETVHRIPTLTTWVKKNKFFEYDHCPIIQEKLRDGGTSKPKVAVSVPGHHFRCANNNLFRTGFRNRTRFRNN